jgi:hypothetical protein
MPSTVYPAPHPAPPQANDFGAGQVLAAPIIVPIFFANEDPTRRAQLEDFEGKLGASQFWAASATEYGVGSITRSAPVTLAETATGTIDDTEIQAWLQGKLDSDDPAFPKMPYGDVIFVIHYPAEVTLTFTDWTGNLSTSCLEFGAYHSSVALDGAHDDVQVAYAAMPVCDPFGPLQGIDAATAPESHELIEAATDPRPAAGAAYASIDPLHLFWEKFLGGGEVGDMCTRLPGVFTTFPDLPYAVQRSWSNQQALAGHDPCVPALAGEVYFNAAAVLKDNVITSVFGQKVYVKGVKIPVGQTRTFALDLFSDGDTGGAFGVDVEDAGWMLGDSSDLSISLDRYEGVNGERLHVTVTVNAPGQDGSALLLITSTLGATQNYWLAIVGS